VSKKKKLFIVVSEDWSFWSHRLPLALSATEAGFDVTLYTKINRLEEEINAKGIKVVNVNFSRSSKSPIIDLLNIIKLTRIFRREKPDIIHNVALKTILVSSMAAAFAKNTVVINAYTGLGYVFSSNQLQAKVIRSFIKPLFRFLMQKKCFWTIFQNPDDMKLFDELKLSSPERSVLIRGSGVDTKEFSQTDDLNEIPVVMLASRILWDKGVGEFVEAAKRIIKENIKAKFILVGDADAANPMSIPVSTLKHWSSEGSISWEGHSNNMPQTLSSASIVCLPSYREGLPKILLEAAATGRPLIATDVPGCREIVRNGENGILVRLKDVESLYDALKLLISNKEMRQSMGQKSRNLVESELSSDIINGQTLALYETAHNNMLLLN
jgi:glycosyltransferase involved in cell wall biosynthesis